MNPLKRLKKVVQNSGSLLEDYTKNYIVISPQEKQLVLKPKAISLLCDQAVSRVEQLTRLVPDTHEGFIATIEHEKIKAKVHFCPEKIWINGNAIEGQLRLLNKPEVKSNSIVYQVLIAGWKIFLGGNLPNQLLPKGLRVDGDQIHFTFPDTQLKLLDALLKNAPSGSALNLDMKKGELKITSTMGINWNEINIQSLLKMINGRNNGE